MTSRNVVVCFTVTGIIIGYAVLHPLTMIIYQFEFNPTQGTWADVFDSVIKRVFTSFHTGMLDMGFIFAAMGGTLGYVSGRCLRSLAHKRSLISIFVFPVFYCMIKERQLKQTERSGNELYQA